MLETGMYASLTSRNIVVQWMTSKLLQHCNYVCYKEDKQEANEVYVYCLACDQAGYYVEGVLGTV